MKSSEVNPWKTLSSREAYSNPWIRVREDQVIRPDGSPGIYGVIEARVATGVVACTEENEVFLVGQYRYPMECYSWEIPEGGAEIGEDPLETIRRELAEEAGLHAKQWYRLGGEFHLSNSFTNERARLYLARDLVSVPSNPEGTEVLQIKKVSFQEALSMVLKGEIHDAMSVIALLMTARVLEGEEQLLSSL